MRKHSISAGRMRWLASQASVDPRTIVKVLEGKAVVGLAGDRARRVLEAAGLLSDRRVA